MTRRFIMEFERPLVELEDKLGQLRKLDVSGDPVLAAEIEELAAELERLHEEVYVDLAPWHKVQVSRHPERPKTQDYVERLFEDVIELRGDRLYADDPAMLAALATFHGRRVAVLGHRKGRDTKENIKRNFGMVQPEGFRKAQRLMRLAAKSSLPLVTFVDTPGAHPGREAEEHGQAWAIAEAIADLASLPVPVVAIGIGEGGSGGALAIGFGDVLLMLQNAYYSVITPEACATILHRDAGMAADVAGPLALTAEDLLELGLADEIVPEPLGGAHRDPGMVYQGVADSLARALEGLSSRNGENPAVRRYERLRSIGAFVE